MSDRRYRPAYNTQPPPYAQHDTTYHSSLSQEHVFPHSAAPFGASPHMYVPPPHNSFPNNYSVYPPHMYYATPSYDPSGYPPPPMYPSIAMPHGPSSGTYHYAPSYEGHGSSVNPMSMRFHGGAGQGRTPPSHPPTSFINTDPSLGALPLSGSRRPPPSPSMSVQHSITQHSVRGMQRSRGVGQRGSGNGRGRGRVGSTGYNHASRTNSAGADVPSDVVCCYFLRGMCHHDTRCRFSHVDRGQACRYGDHCRYGHRSRISGADGGKETACPSAPDDEETCQEVTDVLNNDESNEDGQDVGSTESQ